MRGEWRTFLLETVTSVDEQQDITSPEAAVIVCRAGDGNADVLSASARSTICEVAQQVTHGLL